MWFSEQVRLNPEINRFAEELLFGTGITTFVCKSEPLPKRFNQATLPSVCFWSLKHMDQDKSICSNLRGSVAWSLTLISHKLL
jgi:hypothetical protein